MLLRLLNDFLGKPQFPGDGEGIALAGDADQQVIGGAQALHIKLAACVLHSRSGQSVHLQLAVVGGGHGPDPPPVEAVQDCDGQSRPFRGISPGAQLVKEHQGMFIHVPEEGDDVGHMRRKSTQALLNALLVPDVGEHIVEHRQLAAVQGGDMKPGLSHQGEKAHRLKGHRLPAGIGTGDDQKIEGVSQRNGDGDYLLLVQERMTALPDMDAPFCVEYGSGGVHFQGQGPFGKNEIQLCQQGVIRMDGIGILCRVSAQAGKDHLDLFLLLAVEFF